MVLFVRCCRGSFELAAVVVGKLGTVPLAAHGIFVNTAYLTYLLPMSVAQSITTIAGAQLGAGAHAEARSVVQLGIAVVVVLGLVLGAAMFGSGRYWCTIYTTDETVLNMLDAALPIFALYLIADSFKCVCTIILRSTGRPSVTVWGNTAVCLLILLPVGYVLTITEKEGFVGEWLAMAISWAIAGTAYFVILVRTDWEEQARLAGERNNIASGETSTTTMKKLVNSDIEMVCNDTDEEDTPSEDSSRSGSST